MFEAEAEGLLALAETGAVRVPRLISYGADDVESWIVLEWIDLHPRDRKADAALGRQLAALHRHFSERYGWHRDNTIGRTKQANTWCSSWPEFWREHRLGWQLRLAHRNGYGGALQRDGEKLIDRVGAFFEGYTPAPSLLHGDLWSGNAASDKTGETVIFDPAVYYGDRECDIAMTELFGGFSPAFYEAYAEAWPLDAGYAARKDLYNLYHVLNHLNLFGSAYRAQAERTIAKLLAG